MARIFTPPKPRTPPATQPVVPQEVAAIQAEQAREQGRQEERLAAARQAAEQDQARVAEQEEERRRKSDAAARARGGMLRGRAVLLTGGETGLPGVAAQPEPPPRVLQTRLGG